MSIQNLKKIDKPWGYEILWADTDIYVGKILYVKQGHALSLQYHELKDETIYLEQGKIILEIHSKEGVINTINMSPGDSFRIMPFTIHKIRAFEDSRLYEVSSPHLDDIVRLKDDYGRV